VCRIREQAQCSVDLFVRNDILLFLCLSKVLRMVWTGHLCINIGHTTSLTVSSKVITDPFASILIQHAKHLSLSGRHEEPVFLLSRPATELHLLQTWFYRTRLGRMSYHICNYNSRTSRSAESNEMLDARWLHKTRSLHLRSV